MSAGCVRCNFYHLYVSGGCTCLCHGYTLPSGERYDIAFFDPYGGRVNPVNRGPRIPTIEQAKKGNAMPQITTSPTIASELKDASTLFRIAIQEAITALGFLGTMISNHVSSPRYRQANGKVITLYIKCDLSQRYGQTNEFALRFHLIDQMGVDDAYTIIKDSSASAHDFAIALADELNSRSNG